MNFLELIESKRDGRPFKTQSIHDFIGAFVAGSIPDYQMAAMLMAIFFRGLNPEETRTLTFAMRDSGDVLTFPKDSRPLVDKHSTGGVGDKVSLPLAPLLACLGFRVPMISGRGLGITGGTLDKLESIPGFRTTLSRDEIIEQVQSVGCVICGQTENMVPADKKLYALRDVTGTVPSISLITASILSKKLAENLDHLVLDVKFGSAAFMKTPEAARELAKAMVSLGTECGVNTRAVLTNMNSPLGRAAGNWLEVKESIECLENKGPEDLRELVLTFAAQLMVQARQFPNISAARRAADQVMRSGMPRRKWDEMIVAQGADLDEFNHKLRGKCVAKKVLELKVERSGVVSRCDAKIIGEVVRDLGGGRLQKESTIDSSVGIDQVVKLGESASSGQTLARIHAADSFSAGNALEKLKAAFEVSDGPLTVPLLVSEII